jgi:hypothetical protein
MGGLFADFREKNPVRIASSQGASLSFLLSLAYLAIVVVISIIPIQQFYFSLIFRKTVSPMNLMMSGGLIAFLTLIITVTALKTARGALHRDL